MKERENWLDGELEIDLGRIFRGLRREMWAIVLAAAAAGLAAWMVSLLLPARYEACALFYVKNNTINPGSISSSDIAASKDLVDSYLVILESGDTLEEVIRYAGTQRTRQQVKKMISASAVKSTEFFNVVVTDTDPREAERIAGAIVSILPERIAAILEGTSAKIVNTAVAVAEPAQPRWGTWAAMGAFGGLLLAVLAVSLEAAGDKTILCPQDVRKAGMPPLLAEFSPEETCRSESYRLLRSKLRHLYPPKEKCWVLGFSGESRREGQCRTLVHLAAGLTQLGCKVLLIQCDLLESPLPARQNRKRHPGLGEYLSGASSQEEIIQYVNVADAGVCFPVVTAGSCSGDPAQLLLSDGLPRLLGDLRDACDYILLDLPPRGRCSGLLDTAGLTDGILLQVCRGKSDMATLQNALSQLAFLEVPVPGILYRTKAAGEKGKKRRHEHRSYRRRSGGRFRKKR